jgi:deoxyribodipyrimidine photolyase-related protein
VRQILGWREYVRGIYWLAGPGYVRENRLGATRPLPGFYWWGGSGMRCFDKAFEATRDQAYAHHIQRLMVLGNFALLAGIDPYEVHRWFLVVYADAYEWVEAPNVIGMSQFADGGMLGSKPYAGGGAYINRMSDHCRHCRYDVKQRDGPDACPYNFLYWDFVARHETMLRGNQRMWRVVDGWNRFAPERQAAMRATAAKYMDQLKR